LAKAGRTPKSVRIKKEKPLKPTSDFHGRRSLGEGVPTSDFRFPISKYLKPQTSNLS